MRNSTNLNAYSITAQSQSDLTKLSDVQEHLVALDFYEIESTPAQFAERIKVEFESWRKVVQAAHIGPG